jgi:hypothetical protein
VVALTGARRGRRRRENAAPGPRALATVRA